MALTATKPTTGTTLRFRSDLTTSQFRTLHAGVGTIESMIRAFELKSPMEVSPIEVSRDGHVRASVVGSTSGGTSVYNLTAFEGYGKAAPFEVAIPAGTDPATIRRVLALLRALGFEMESTDETMLGYLTATPTFGKRYGILRAEPLAGSRVYVEAVRTSNGGKQVPLGVREIAEAAALLVPAVPPVPVAPTTVGSYSVDYRSNGDVKVGCTTVSAADVDLIYAESQSKRKAA